MSGCRLSESLRCREALKEEEGDLEKAEFESLTQPASRDVVIPVPAGLKRRKGSNWPRSNFSRDPLSGAMAKWGVGRANPGFAKAVDWLKKRGVRSMEKRATESAEAPTSEPHAAKLRQGPSGMLYFFGSGVFFLFRGFICSAVAP